MVDGIMDGDAEYLMAGKHQFLAIYTGAENPMGGVVIMHGRGFHPDWNDVANPLRVGLAEWLVIEIRQAASANIV